MILQARIVESARGLVGRPYAFRREDCASGLAENCFTLPMSAAAANGVLLPRDLYALLRRGPIVQIGNAADLRPFDLLLSKSAWGGYSVGSVDVGHLTIATGDGNLIDASATAGKVVEVSANGSLTCSDRWTGFVLRLFD